MMQLGADFFIHIESNTSRCYLDKQHQILLKQPIYCSQTNATCHNIYIQRENINIIKTEFLKKGCKRKYGSHYVHFPRKDEYVMNLKLLSLLWYRRYLTIITTSSLNTRSIVFCLCQKLVSITTVYCLNGGKQHAGTSSNGFYHI